MTTYIYIRVSTEQQKLDRQVDKFLERYPEVKPENIFTDKATGKSFDRPGYAKLKTKLQKGDLLLLDSLDRLGRDYDGIIREWKGISRQIGADIVSMENESLLDTRKFTQMGDMGKMIEDIMLTTMSWAADNERKKILQRTAEGRRSAIARGVKMGAKPKEIREFPIYYEKVQKGEMSINQAVEALGIGKGTWYNREKQLFGD